MKKYNVLTSALTVMCAVGAFMLSSTQAQAQLLQDGLYFIYSANSTQSNQELIVDPNCSTTHGTDMQIQNAPPVCDNQNNLFWTLTNLGNNVITLINSASGLALDVSGDSKNPGALVDQWPYSGTSNQKWQVVAIPGSTNYELVSVNSGLVLDCVGGSNKSGTKVDQYNYQGKLWQQWNMILTGD